MGRLFLISIMGCILATNFVSCAPQISNSQINFPNGSFRPGRQSATTNSNTNGGVTTTRRPAGGLVGESTTALPGSVADSNSKTTARPPSNGTNSEATLPVNVRQCVEKCPSTSQYNPVCGDDNITYTNRQKMLCAQSCNHRVNQAYLGACQVTSSQN